MKAITLWQPWATLIAIGAKHFETRSWATNYRGPLAIHAAKRPVEVGELNRPMIEALHAEGYTTLGKIPLGCIVCVVDLVDVLLATEASRSSYWSDRQQFFGDFSPGRFAWRLDNVRLVDSIPATGSQGFWEWTPPEGFDL